jgi:PAS domain S-box-containing protein
MAEPHTYEQIIRLADKEYRQYAGLPFAVYLVTTEGVFLSYNGQARDLFNLPAAPTFEHKVTDFYLHPDDRKENLDRLCQVTPGQWLQDTTIDLLIEGKIKHVRDFTKGIWEGNDLVGLLCFMIPMTKSDRYHRLFNDLPVGIFSFRREAGLIHANPRFLQMHGYDHFEEVNGMEASAFLKNPNDLKKMEKKLWEQGRVNNEYQEHIRRDGSTFTASVSARAIFNNEGAWTGTEGILEDVTTEAIYFQLVNEVPIGLYSVRINEEEQHLLLHCNQRFAENRGLQPEELIGEDLRLFHKTMEDFDHFYRKLIKKDREGLDLVDYILEAYNGKGQLRRYEVHIKLLKDLEGRITGRIGAERDVTDYWDTKQQLDELTTDIGKVLHSYSSTLIHSKQTMDAVIRSFAADKEITASEGLVDEEKVRNKIHQLIRPLDTFFARLFERNEKIEYFDEPTSQKLRRILALIGNQEQGKMEVQQIALIRDGAIYIKKVIEQIPAGNFPRELIKQIKRQMREILRLCSLITLSRGVGTVLEMETVVNNLRGYVLTRVKQKEPLQRLDLFDLLIGAVRKMEEFANNRNIDLRLNAREIRNAYIDGYEEDLVRALLNVLHNAIKYSWTRQGPSRSFVSIEGKADAEWIYLSIENWGVAITTKELEQDLIFKVGYRGVNSSDRRRPGTGLGLYDARKVIEKHHGTLRITSEPTFGNPPDDYSHPFVTTVTIQLPRNRAVK